METTDATPCRDDRPLDGLLAEYLQRIVQGETPSLDEYLARLATEAERVEFRELADIATALENLPNGQFEVGAVLGSYEIRAELGAGGMGVVFRAYDTRLQRDVAIKVLNARRAADHLSQQQFERERLVLARLKHPGIVTVHEAGVLNDQHYLVLDLVDGVGLDKILETLAAETGRSLRGGDLLAAIGRPCPPGISPVVGERENYHRAAARIVREIARAVEAAHGVRVFHRDLTPRNVMLKGGGTPVILDFGLAASEEEISAGASDGFAGTAAYVAPEQARTRRTGTDPRSDVYQVGVILYELLTRTRAFHEDVSLPTGARIQAVLENVREGRFTPPREVRPEIQTDLEAICRKAMAKGLGQRYQSAQELREDLDRFLALRPIAARPPAIPRRLALFTRRNPVPVTALVAVVALSAALVFAAGRSNATEIIKTFRVAKPWGTPPPVSVESLDPVYEGDGIGMDITVNEPTWVYVLSVVGSEPGKPRYVSPLHPGLMTKMTDLVANPPRELGIRLAQGTNRVGLARIGTAPSGVTRWYEGFWVFLSPSDHPWMRDWFEALTRERDRDQPGVALQRAQEILAVKTRGDSLKDVKPEDLRKLVESFTKIPTHSDEVWPLEDPRRFKIYLERR